jgi:curved DNA-binding protein CbpA
LQYATGLLQSFWYKLTVPVGQTAPRPGSPLYAYHHRRIRVFVLCLYLLYTLAQSLYDIKLAGDFYTALGVSPASSEREVKNKFRRLAAKFHPDKIRENDAVSASDSVFLHLKLAQDTILDPAKKFAYDRFGPVVVQLTHPGLKTIRDYVYAGLRAKAPEYAANALLLVILNYVWLPQWGQFWRYFAVMVMALLELFFLTHAWQPHPYLQRMGLLLHARLPDLLPPHLLPFQLLTIARRLSMSLNIFISQLAPPSVKNKAAQDQQSQQQLSHLTQATERVNAEASSLLQLGLSPFANDRANMRKLRDGMTETLMMSTVRNSPEVREAISRVARNRSGTSTTN